MEDRPDSCSNLQIVFYKDVSANKEMYKVILDGPEDAGDVRRNPAFRLRFSHIVTAIQVSLSTSAYNYKIFHLQTF